VLGVKQRAFERAAAKAVAAGVLRKQFWAAKTGQPFPLVVFYAEDVERLRDERSFKPIPVRGNFEDSPAAAPFVPSMRLPALSDPPIAAYAYLTLAEAAGLIRMPASWLRKQIAAGRLPAEFVGRSPRVLRRELETRLVQPS